MRSRVRVLGTPDLPEALDLLTSDPVTNLFVTARVRQFGLDPFRLGCEVWGYESRGRLVSLCHAGSNLVPIGDPVALDAFVEKVGPRRRASSIMGDAELTMDFWTRLSKRWGTVWEAARDVRAHQPLMLIDHPASGATDDRVHRVELGDLVIYFEAAVKMYTEEVGVSPLDPTRSYEGYVRRLITEGRAFGIVENGRVIYKSDIGSAAGSICQVQGVWLDPELRGRGLSEPAMARVVELCQEHFPVVSLYVNDFNVRARRLYEGIGFRTVGELATVLF